MSGRPHDAGDVSPPMMDRLWNHRRSIGEALLLAALALAVRLPHLESATPWYDDFWHLLAARHLLLDGTFGLANGEYTRAALFTRLVAGSLNLFGDSLAAGRVPAVIAGTLWAASVFLWFRHVGGAVAGWTAGLLLALDPGAIHLSQWVRFYTLHGLMVWIGAICVYHLVSPRLEWRRGAALAIGAVVAFAIALPLQETTLIALGAAGLWTGGVLVWSLPGWLSRGQHPGRRIWLLVGGGLALSVAALWFVGSGTALGYWQAYTRPFFWTEGSTADFRWYFWWLVLQYPTLWTLFPVAIVVAVARFPRPAIYSLVMFVSSFLVISFGPAQQERYLYFAMPFFFGLWGLAAATLLPAFKKVGERAVAAMGDLGLGPGRRSLVAGSFVVMAAGFIASQNDAPRTTVRMVFPGGGERPYREADWASVLPQLRTLTDSADVVLSSYVLKPLYYFDRGDYHLSWTETAEAGFENGRPVEFTLDGRTGLPAISTPESIEAVMACFESGLILTEEFHLNRVHLLPDATTAFIFDRTEEVPLPPDSWVRAFRWRHEIPPSAPRCTLSMLRGNATAQSLDLPAAR